ncbi:MAG TPA: septal ring lytic transglycosylase RlpA family protein [Burkholderiaceae bacterium]|nr:septal ring lytic transglycosylase RlpA family protein [Burkholderiaceae bacterium]
MPAVSRLPGMKKNNALRLAVVAAALVGALAIEQAQAAERIEVATDQPTADLSGRTRTGIASFYAAMFFGRKMADGKPMDPDADNAASRTLPLGTRARVTNLETGESALVTIQDRGPYVQGRIIDLSPATALAIGITPKMGLAKVEVTPIFVPLPDGRVRWGAGSRVAMTADRVRNE